MGGGNFSYYFSKDQTVTTSAADIIIPTKETSIFEDMQILVQSSGPDKNDQAIVLCIACIEARWDTISQIIETGLRCGLGNRHIAKILQVGIGNRWRLDKAGHYSMMD